jgi:hypothetical protein
MLLLCAIIIGQRMERKQKVDVLMWNMVVFTLFAREKQTKEWYSFS